MVETVASRDPCRRFCARRLSRSCWRQIAGRLMSRKSAAEDKTMGDATRSLWPWQGYDLDVAFLVCPGTPGRDLASDGDRRSQLMDR
jgi:hypothetical protein